MKPHFHHVLGRSRAALRRALIALASFHLLLCGSIFAQNINAIVAPGGSVDIQNTTANRWYFFTAPASGGATMSRVSSDLVSVYTWPDQANFAPDPGVYTRDRIFQGEYLRVYAGTLAAGSVITIPYATPNPLSSNYTFTITVSSAAYVTAINIIDPSPTVAASVRWGVTFSASISGVTTANFVLTNPNGLSGATITGVSGSGSNWIVTATTGTGTGLLGCNWAGHVSETPPVPAAFTGQQYTFSPYPLITLDPVGNTNVVSGTNFTMTAAATLRGGGAVKYQWYLGTSVNPGAATLISGATSSFYTATNLAAGTHQYFCRAINSSNTAYAADSLTATVIAFDPVHIVNQPASTVVGSGQTATLSVGVTGTLPHFKWYLGAAGDTSNPVGSDSSSYTTPVLSTNTHYWVLVYNALPPAYNQNSATAAIRVVTSLAGNGPLVTLVNEGFLPPPAVTVRDSAGALVSGFAVTLTVNGNTASGSFGGLASTTVTSDGSGVASAACTANAGAGTFTVTAKAGPVVTASIALRNVAQLAVSTTADEDNGSIDPSLGTGMSLREAVNLAGTHPGAHTITFVPALTAGGPATVSLTQVGDNTSGPSALVVSSMVTIQGPASGGGITLAASSAGNLRHFYVASSGALTLANLTLTGGAATNSGGGSIASSGTLNVLNSTFTGNSTLHEGGAIWTPNSGGVLTLTNSTFANNTSGYYGGAIANACATTRLTRVTMVDNVSGAPGGALLQSGTPALLLDTIVARNTNAGAPSDIVLFAGGTVDPNSKNNLVGAGGSGGLVNGQKGNLVGVAVTDLHLGSLANGGGPTMTVALLPGSPALNAGAAVPGLTTDQRGLPQVGSPDIGAFESQVVPPVTVLNPQYNSLSFQCSFLSQSGFTHAVQYRTNLVAGSNWQTYSNVVGDGALKTIPIPLSVFSPSRQGFVRVSTQ